MDFLIELIKFLGGTAALLAVVAFLAKLLAQHWLVEDLEQFKLGLAQRLEAHKADLTTRLESHKSALLSEVETHKAKLALENSKAIDTAKFEFEQQLILRRGEVDLFREGYKLSAESEKQRAERLRTQIQRWALPIQGAIGDLSHRLRDVLTDDGYLMLDETTEKIDGWSADYGYFMSSTVYYFAQYFCWTRLMQQQMGYELFESTGDMRKFIDYVNTIGDTLSRFPYYPDGDPDDMRDFQVFRLQQRAIGELLLTRLPSGEQVMTYREFFDKWSANTDEEFLRHIKPIVQFLNAIKNSGDLRWTRLDRLVSDLDEFSTLCNALLQSGSVTNEA